MAKRSLKSRLFPRAIVFALLYAAIVIPGVAQNAQPKETVAAARMRSLNNSILHLHGQMQQAGPAQARLLRGQARTAIAQRQQALLRLIQNEPHAALAFSFSPELLADLAAKFPQSASLLESHVTVTGTVQHWIADYPGLKSSRSIWQMDSAGGPVTLYFAYKEPSNLKPSESLQAIGVISGSQMVVESSAVVRQGSSQLGGQESPNTLAKSSPKPHFPAMLLLGSGFLFLLPGFRFNTRASSRRISDLARQFAVLGLIIGVIGSISMPIYAQGSCTTKGVQNTAVILVNLPNGVLPAGVTQSSAQDVFFATNTPGVSVDGFLQAASYGQASAKGDVFGPFNLSGTYTTCSDVTAVQNDAFAAATAFGANLNNYSRLFLIFPDVLGCGWAGYTSNSCSVSSSTGTFNASLTYLAARYTTPRATGVEVASHEFGHNLGLMHSGTVTSGTEALGPISAPGTWTDAGDYWSVMGETVLGLYPAPQKAEVMGWMTPGTNFQTVQSSGTYTLQPMETNPPGLQALKVQRGTGNNAWLWIEYRQPVGDYDSMLWSQPFTGALIHYEDSNTLLGHSYLPNFTPSDTTGKSPALAAGQTWQDPYSNLSISVLSATPTGLTVNVNYGAVPCTPATPTVSVTPADPSAYVGANVAYAVSIQNNDSSGCSSSTLNVASTLPAGWPTSFSSGSVTLSPGQSASVTMYKSGPAGTAPGTYAVNANAANNSYMGSATANITLMSAPSMTATLTVPAASFNRPTTVPITATVLNGGLPVSGASVTFTMTTPSGSTTTQSATTGSNGVANWSYKASTRTAAGSYSVSSKASVTTGSKKNATTQSATSNATSFILY